MIYLIRHGETYANISDTWQGQSCDDKLDEKGIEQAQQVSIYLSDKDIKKVVSSDLMRAIQTAESISKRLELNTQEDPLLREMNYGEIEGLDTDEIQDEFSPLYNKWFQQPEMTVFPDGESFKDLMSRAKQVVQKYFYTDENIVLVSHGDMIKAIIVTVSGKISEYHLPHVTNTSITTFVNDNGKIIIKDIADTPHL